MESNMTNTKAPHVLAIPFPAHGHMIPFLDLSTLLASHGLSITFVTTPSNAPRLQPHFQRAQSAGLAIRPLYLSLPTSYDCDIMEDLTPDRFPSFIYSFRLLHEPLEQWIMQQQQQHHQDTSDGPPVCIISDYFLGWTHQTALKAGIPRVVFHPSGAFGVSVTYSLWTHMPHLGVESDQDTFSIPELALDVCFRRPQISRFARLYSREDPVFEFIRNNILANIHSWGTLINTFHELEGIHVDHLEKLSGRPVWSVGPVLPASENKTQVISRGKMAAIHVSDCVDWLDAQERGSVLYVCFGSHVVLSECQLSELALGLEGIECPFIWVIRDLPSNNNNEGSVLPEGFEGRVRDKGLIIRGWAPQLLILSNPSVGGFLSHCGWNSTPESISMGIPMITWPMSADQFSNALLIVEHLRFGVQFCEGDRTVPNREALKRAVGQVLGRDFGGEERKRAENLRDLARSAVEKGGSSYQSLDAFVMEMKNLQAHSPWSYDKNN